jgi:hypothetical protein
MGRRAIIAIVLASPAGSAQPPAGVLSSSGDVSVAPIAVDRFPGAAVDAL